MTISEHPEYSKPSSWMPIPVPVNDINAQLRLILKRALWAVVVEEAKAKFNRACPHWDSRSANGSGPVRSPINRTLGKELCVLAWAVEDCDPALLPAAIRT